MYASATWKVKAGHETAFARLWQENADQIALDNPGVTFRLLRNTENASHFVSITGPWRGAEHFERVRDSTAFQDWLGAVEETLESGEIASYELVVEIS